MRGSAITRLAAAAATAAITAFAVYAITGFGTQASTPQSSANDRASAVKGEFAALRRAQLPSDRENNPFATSGAHLGVALSDVRVLRHDADWTIWAAPSNNGACLTFAGPSDAAGASEGTCAPLRSVQEQGLVDVSVPPKRGQAVEFAALVPDGVQTVSVSLADGSTVAAAVQSNAAVAATKSQPVSMSYTDAGGAKHSLQLGGR